MTKKLKLTLLVTFAFVLVVLIGYFILGRSERRLPQSSDAVPKFQSTISGQNAPLNHPLDIQVSPKGQLFVTDSGNNQVKVFEPNGQFVRAFGKAGTAPGQFNTPYGLGFLPDGSVLVSDMLNFRIQRFSAEGKFLGMFLDQAQKIKPGLMLIKDGLVYISDLATHQIVVLNKDGKVLRKYTAGMNFPQGLSIIDDKLFVADAGNNLIREFTVNNDTVGNKALASKNSFQMLRGMAVDNLKRILVVDSLASQVKFVTDTGEVLFSIGSTGKGQEQFMYPAGICIDKVGKIYVADWGNNRIQVWGY